MKENRKFVLIGTLLAAVTFFALSAFQQPVLKFGVVDVSKVAEDSKLGKRKKDEFEKLRVKMTAILQFMNQNRLMSKDQATKFRELSLLDKPTADQTQQLEGLKTLIQRAKQEFDDLLKVSNPTETQLKRIQELSGYGNDTLERLRDWDREFGQQMSELASNAQTEVLSKAREAVKKLGKRDGYTIIHESNSAPYGANDVTTDVLKVFDADTP